MTRDRAIEILRDDASGASLWELAEAVEMGIKALEEQRPHGEWISQIYETIEYYQCSVCKMLIRKDKILMALSWKYCPNCGSDNRKEGDDK